jgi:hypothetical protein
MCCIHTPQKWQMDLFDTNQYMADTVLSYCLTLCFASGYLNKLFHYNLLL